jgi:hypothetical protein
MVAETKILKMNYNEINTHAHRQIERQRQRRTERQEPEGECGEGSRRSRNPFCREKRFQNRTTLISTSISLSRCGIGTPDFQAKIQLSGSTYEWI